MANLSNEDKSLLCDQVRSVIEWSQGGLEVHPEDLIDHWFASKHQIIDAFTKINGEFSLIVELDEMIEMDLSEQEKEHKLNTFLSQVGYRDEMVPLHKFVKANKDGFFQNLVVEDYTIGNQVITKGSKLLKAFKFFVKDEEERKWIQDKASIAIQESKITGKLCLSVHPLDYLSSSENTYNWRSCHALDGEYRTGNLNYMCDKATIVCYLKGAEEAHLPNFPNNVLWNSKKWRCLLFLSDDWKAMFAGKQYPMTIDRMLDKLQLVARTALNLGDNWSKWHDDQITDFRFKSGEDTQSFANPYIPMAGKIYPIRNLIKDGEWTHHYNDLLRSTCYVPFYCWSKDWSKENLHFHIGEEVKCLHCGQERMGDHDMMFCRDCYEQDEPDGSCCDDCGNFTLDRDLHYIEEYDVWVCDWCYQHNYFTCNCCYNLTATASMVEYEGHQYCTSCYEEIKRMENDINNG